MKVNYICYILKNALIYVFTNIFLEFDALGGWMGRLEHGAR